MINFGTFNEIQAHCGIVKPEGEYCTWSSPGTDHKMMEHSGGCCVFCWHLDRILQEWE